MTSAAANPTTSVAAALPPIEAFRAGRHLSAGGQLQEWTAADLQELADSYDPALREAPICVGHPKGNAPAFGWIGKVVTDGQVLKALPSTVQPEFRDWVGRKLFKKVSVSIYGREHPGNPVPGKLYLRHVGFLGAAPPAVAGLADYAFADDGGEVIEFWDWSLQTLAPLVRGLRDWLIGKFGQDEADKALPAYAVQQLGDLAAQDMVTPSADTAEADDGAGAKPASNLSYSEGETMPGTTDLAEREAALAAAQAKLAADQAALAEAQRKTAAAARAAEFSDFYDGLVKEGRALPANKAAVVAVLGTLAGCQVLEFDDGGTAVSKPAVDVLKDALKAQPVVVDFSERAPAGKGAALDTEDAQSIARAAQEFQDAEAQAGREVSFAAAVAHVTRDAGDKA